MRANEARKNAVAATSGNMKEIHSLIKAASKKGQLSIFFYEKISDEQLKSLKRDGYTVEDKSGDSGRGYETLYEISW